MASSYIKQHEEILRFLIAGGIVDAVDFGVYYTCLHVVSFDIAKAISFACASTAGYFFNKYWTFGQHQTSFIQIVQYLFINFLALALDVFINRSVLNFLHHQILIAVVVATLGTGLFTYAAFKWWVFTRLKSSIVR